MKQAVIQSDTGMAVREKASAQPQTQMIQIGKWFFGVTPPVLEPAKPMPGYGQFNYAFSQGSSTAARRAYPIRPRRPAKFPVTALPGIPRSCTDKVKPLAPQPEGEFVDDVSPW